MFNIEELININLNSNKRDTFKKQVLDGGRDYIQISTRTQNGKTYINAINYTPTRKTEDGEYKGSQYSKKQSLKLLLDYINGVKLDNTEYGVNSQLENDMKNYLKNNKVKL